MVSVISELLTSFATFLGAFGYFGLFAVSFIAAFALPVPSSSILSLSGALAAKGDMNIYAVLATAFFGNVCADLLAFWIARVYGITTLRRWGFGRILDSELFSSFDRYISIHAPSIIYVSRVVTSAGPAVNILAGLGKVRARVFIVFGMLGEVSFVLLFGLSGYFLGDAWQNNTGFLFKGLLVLILLGAIGGVAQYALRTRLSEHRDNTV